VLERARPLQDSLRLAILAAEHYERRALALSTRLADDLLELRMCRFGEGVHALPRMVRDLARGIGKDVRLELDGVDTLVDRAVLARMEGPLASCCATPSTTAWKRPQERRAAGKPAPAPSAWKRATAAACCRSTVTRRRPRRRSGAHPPRRRRAAPGRAGFRGPAVAAPS
jgi:hypothetical protein